MGLHTPIPHSLRSEAKKAAKILQDFSIPNAKTGPDAVIPASILAKAEGLAIITVVKVGFLVTARGGSGIVIARLNDRDWSAPSAIGLAGLGGGFEVGAEVTDFVIILNTRSAVEAFSKGGNLTLGGNFTIAAGPLGRNVEGDVSVRSPAAIFTYSKTKGLFAGISIEGSYLVERKDANKKFYCQDIRASEILSGYVEKPRGCEDLYDILAEHKEAYDCQLLEKAKKCPDGSSRRSFFSSSTRSSSHSSERTVSRSFSQKSTSSSDGAGAKGRVYGRSQAPQGGGQGSPDSGFSRSSGQAPRGTSQAAPRDPRTVFCSSGMSALDGKERICAVQTSAWDEPPRCRALYSFQPKLPCDLAFESGDIIEIMTRTETQNDWWEGTVHGKIGIFPANYVQLI